MISRFKRSWLAGTIVLLMGLSVYADQSSPLKKSASRNDAPTEIETEPPSGFPAASKVLRSKLSSGSLLRINRTRCELIGFRLEKSRNYPLIGPARLARGRFKVTIIADEQTEVSFIDWNSLLTTDGQREVQIVR